MNEVETLKDALYQTVHGSELSIAAIADEIDMSANYLYKSCLPDPDMDDRATGVRFPLKKLLPLCRVTKDYTVIRFLAHSTGYALIPINRNHANDCNSVQQLAMDSAAEFGDLMRVIHTATADRVISAAERAQITKEGWEAIEAILNAITICDSNGR